MSHDTMVEEKSEGEEKEVITRPFEKLIERNGPGRNGHLKIIELYSSPSGLPSAIDVLNNQLIRKAPGSVTIEAIGMTKAGRSQRLMDAAERLIADEKLEEILGRKPIVTIFKPNSIAKNLFEKNPETRADFHEYICNLHRNVLLELKQPPRQNIKYSYTDVVLLDRGSYDDIFWSYALPEFDGKLLPEIRRKDSLDMSERTIRDRLIDIVIGINVPPVISLEREGKRGDGRGKVMNLEFLSLIHRFYTKAESEEKIRKGLYSLYKSGQITEEDYNEQTKDFLIRNTEYVSINGMDPKETNSNKIFYSIKKQLLYNHGIPEELEYKMGQT
ncbi:hypothetical protein HYT56_05230 [Candidatus Woesearchaeota archaeon]|nr:hypothetical protein [Candidatus Woesearchaeota archaeon]